MIAPMGKPNRLRDMLGVVILLAVGLLYVAGATLNPREVGMEAKPEADAVEASSTVEPMGPTLIAPEIRT